MTVYSDTEDDSPELAKRGLSGFEKRCTQIGAITETGAKFHLIPKVTRTILDGPWKRHQWDCQPFLKWLCNLEPDGLVTCYYHNAGYDLGNIWPDSLDSFDCTLVGNRLISARWRNVRFLDSANIWPMSLAKVGDAVGLKKGKTDVYSPEYMFQDIAIEKKAMETATAIAAKYQVELPATLGGLCVRLWKSMGGRNWSCSLLPARNAYYGGRVEIFQKEVRGRMKYCDVNSLYPSVMLEAFPDADDLWFDLSTLDEAEQLLVSDRPCWGVCDVTLKIPETCFVAPLPVRREDGAIYYPVGKVSGWWTVHEIRRALAMGAKLVELRECYGSRTATCCYAAFVREFYGRREHETDPGRRLFWKLCLNNLYGQLGMTGKITRSLLLAKHVAQLNGETVLTREGIPYGTKLLGEVSMPLNDHVNWLHAAYVTSYARLKLLDFMALIPNEKLVYCDTDSIFFEWGDEPLPFPLSGKLGEMKLEDELWYAHCVSPKLYRTLGMKEGLTTKAKGIPRREGPDGRYGRTLPDIFMDDSQVSFLQPWKLRESIRYVSKVEGGFQLGEDMEPKRLSSWHEVEKRIVSGYDKKTLKKNRYFPKKHLIG